jgi:hypothetical protein
MVCSISIAHAVGMAWLILPPTASQAARHRHGRTRFPPANSEYLQAIVFLLKVHTGKGRRMRALQEQTAP